MTRDALRLCAMLTHVALLCVSASALDYRSVDGEGNNLTHTSWGQAGATHLRIAPSAYGDGLNTPAHGSFAGAREISNAVVAQSTSTPEPRGLSDYTWAWGQFIDHDMTHTLLQSGGETINITIPAGDPVYTPGAVIPVDRSQVAPGTGVTTPREQVNNISAYLDASMVYGGRANEADGGQARADWLRTFSNGMMKVTSDPLLGDLLPTVGADPNAPEMAGDSMIGPATFVAGDVRANEHAVLTSLHTVFVREHNRLAAIIDATHADLPGDPALRDEQIYQRARRLVGAQVQAITYNEFLPALGIHLPTYAGYDDTVDATISTEFATAGFRLGHSLINVTVKRMNDDGTPYALGPMNLFEGFFDPTRITDEGGIEMVLRGLALQYAQRVDARISDDLRNLLFVGMPGGGPVANGTDLAALNIQRGRDHGLADYNTTRLAFGLSPVASFADITSDVDLQNALMSVYTDVDSIDLWIGMLAEDHAPGASLGLLNMMILSDQFIRLRDGDRFWYENDAVLSLWDSPAGDGGDALDWLYGRTLGDVIRENTGITYLHDSVFVVNEVPEPVTTSLLALGAAALLMRRRR